MAPSAPLKHLVVANFMVKTKSWLQRFEEWMAQNGRVYKDAQEKELRYNIFKSNVEFIEAFNKNKDQGKYTLSIISLRITPMRNFEQCVMATM
ncbi:hypothetical protein Prudu_727S000300 [Prunus dulcis]|uniref:Cathepsin propeptide inhibitor domain-containing protein n=1 Tax=Prunus dulcis TaxID=3755 RepID=A0A5H2XPZ8_PRUDU|nr:hypothetical protein Prudu_727S000300 [Prunus dulcis]